jgi:hypothetical protein
VAVNLAPASADKKAAYRAPASIDKTVVISPDAMKKLAQSKTLPTETSAQLKKQIAPSIERFKKELGSDGVGVVSLVFLLKELAPQIVAADPKMAVLCATQKTCPVPLALLYAKALDRLDAATDIQGKELMQENLMRSDVSIKDKKTILAHNLASTKILNMKPTSKMVDKDHVALGDDLKYLVLTARELRALDPESTKFIQLVFATIERSHDPIAKKLFTSSLLNAYPEYKKQITDEANKLQVQMITAQK